MNDDAQMAIATLTGIALVIVSIFGPLAYMVAGIEKARSERAVCQQVAKP